MLSSSELDQYFFSLFYDHRYTFYNSLLTILIFEGISIIHLILPMSRSRIYLFKFDYKELITRYPWFAIIKNENKCSEGFDHFDIRFDHKFQLLPILTNNLLHGAI